jgi:hypothetical protein
MTKGYGRSDMARENLVFIWRRASMMGGTIAFAIPVIANIAQATVNSPGQASFVGKAGDIDRSGCWYRRW